MKPLLFSLFFLPSIALSAGFKWINPGDESALNFNFNRIETEFDNTVHKNSTETVTGMKTFKKGIRFIDGTVQTTAASGAAAAGSTGQVQYNNGGAFAADPQFTFDPLTNAVTVSSITTTHINVSTLTFRNLGGSIDPQLRWDRNLGTEDFIGFFYNGGIGGLGYVSGGTSYAGFGVDKIRMNNSSESGSSPNFTDSLGSSGLYVGTHLVGISESSLDAFHVEPGTITISRHIEYHLLSPDTVPTISACGATPSGSAAGTDMAGEITVGGGVVTSCTMTFKHRWHNNATCTVTTNSTTALAAITSASQFAITITLTATLGGGTIYYQCSSYN